MNNSRKILVYISEARQIFDEVELKKLGAQATQFNSQMGITGFLQYTSRKFLQCLEGSSAELNLVYTRIAKDPRHDVIIRVQFDHWTPQILFENWSMQIINKKNDRSFKIEKILQLNLETLLNYEPTSLNERIKDIVNEMAHSRRHHHLENIKGNRRGSL